MPTGVALQWTDGESARACLAEASNVTFNDIYFTRALLLSLQIIVAQNFSILRNTCIAHKQIYVCVKTDSTKVVSFCDLIFAL